MSAGVTVLRCCRSSTQTLCPACVRRLPASFRAPLVKTYADADLYGHAVAVDRALGWLRAHRGGRPRKTSQAPPGARP